MSDLWMITYGFIGGLEGSTVNLSLHVEMNAHVHVHV